MPRINAAKNFAGVSYATSKQVTAEIQKGYNYLTVDTAASTEAIITALASSQAVVGNIVLVNAGDAKGTYVVTAASDYTATAVAKLAADASVLSDITALTDAIKIDGTGTTDGIGQAIYSIVDRTVVADGQDTFKIKPSVLPDLAITDVYTLAVTGSNYTAGTTTVADLVKSAITAAGVQKGDVVILTASDAAIAEAVAGTYIFTADVPAKANITASDFVKMYVPAGTVKTINTSLTPDASGNVVINIADVGNVTGVTSFSYASGATSVNGTQLANESEITAINTVIGVESDPSESVEATGIFARLEAIEASIGGGESGIAAQLAAEIAARSEDDVILKTAVEKAVEIESISKTLNGYTTGTKAGANQVVTINDLAAGLIVAVLNASGEQVYPTITYSNGVATLVANYEDGDVDATWTIYKTKAITANLVNTVAESSEESGQE